jgi:hypothetical protein
MSRSGDECLRKALIEKPIDDYEKSLGVSLAARQARVNMPTCHEKRIT